jgi:hypothetical protein
LHTHTHCHLAGFVIPARMQTTLAGTDTFVACLQGKATVEQAGQMFNAATQLVFGGQDGSSYYHPVPSQISFLQADVTYAHLGCNQVVGVLIPYPGTFRTYLWPDSVVVSMSFVTPDCLTDYLLADQRPPPDLVRSISTSVEKRCLSYTPYPRHIHRGVLQHGSCTDAHFIHEPDPNRMYIQAIVEAEEYIVSTPNVANTGGDPHYHLGTSMHVSGKPQWGPKVLTPTARWADKQTPYCSLIYSLNVVTMCKSIDLPRLHTHVYVSPSVYFSSGRSTFAR